MSEPKTVVELVRSFLSYDYEKERGPIFKALQKSQGSCQEWLQALEEASEQFVTETPLIHELGKFCAKKAQRSAKNFWDYVSVLGMMDLMDGCDYWNEAGILRKMARCAKTTEEWMVIKKSVNPSSALARRADRVLQKLDPPRIIPI